MAKVKSPRNHVVVSLILRVVTAVVLALSIAIMVTDTFKLDGEDKVTFKDVYTFRYLVMASLVAFGYNVLQIILHIVFLIIRKLACPTFTLYFDFIADEVIAYLLASSASAALAVAFEVRRVFRPFFIAFVDAEGLKKIDNFFAKAEQSAALALVATLTMIFVSIISARFLFKNY